MLTPLKTAGLWICLLWLSTVAQAECDDPVALDVRLNGWSEGLVNARYINAERSGLDAASIEQLSPAWVFALPKTEAPRSQPAITSNTVFIADADRYVYALDRASGCQRWRFDAGSMVRTALRLVDTARGMLLTFGTIEAELVAIDASSGQPAWQTRVADHPRAMISGSTAEHNGVLYQGVSSWEIFWAANPFYSCCSFRGALLAIDATSGEIIWRSHTIEQAAAVVIDRRILPDHKGPSGAPIWSQPAIDVERGLIYVGTGENYSSPATSTSDAILAFRMSDGELVWQQQFTRNDAWNVACVIPGHINCPEENGGDLDFGAPPILATVDGRDYILAGQKSGRVFALDPDRNGELIWSSLPGGGGKAGGIHFGMAIHPERKAVYVPISDRDVGMLGDSSERPANPSLHAIDIASGKTLWEVAAPDSCKDQGGKPIKDCFSGYSAPVTVTGELVFAPTLDGVLRAYHASDGRELWQFNTHQRFAAVNGGSAEGGALDLGGAYVVDGELYISSGYGMFDQFPGNAFIAFKRNQASTSR